MHCGPDQTPPSPPPPIGSLPPLPPGWPSPNQTLSGAGHNSPPTSCIPAPRLTQPQLALIRAGWLDPIVYRASSSQINLGYDIWRTLFLCYIFIVVVLTIYTVFSRNCFRDTKQRSRVFPAILLAEGSRTGWRHGLWGVCLALGPGLASQAYLPTTNGLEKDSHVCSQPPAGQAEKGLRSFTHRQG